MELADDETSGQEIYPENYSPKTLRSENQKRDRLPFQECAQIGLSLAMALEHLHKAGLVHRDIKPANIIFVNGIPKLADIGTVAKVSESQSFVGTEGFIPPEGPGTPQADVYSLGKVLYEISTGKDRKEFPNPVTEQGEGPDRDELLEMNEVVLRACESDPRKRYASSTEMRGDLALLLGGKSVKRLRHRARGRKWALTAAAVTLAAGAGAWWVQWHEARSVKRVEMIREAQMRRIGERWSENFSNGVALASWSSNALALLRRAGRVEVTDDLRAQAVATFAGLDGHALGWYTNFGAAHAAFDSQGRRLLIDDAINGPVRVWELSTRTMRNLTSTNVGPLWFERDGSPRQFAYSGAGEFVVLNPESGLTLRKASLSLDDSRNEVRVEAKSVSPDGSICGAALTDRPSGTNGWLAVWETATGKLLKSLPEACTALAFSPGNECLATGDLEGRVRVRRLPDLDDVVVPFHEDRVRINCLTLRDDPREPADTPGKSRWLLAAGDAGGTIRIFRVPSRTVQAICRGSAYDVLALAFSPDGMTLASIGRCARLWDVASGGVSLALPGGMGGEEGEAIAFSPDGATLVNGWRSSQLPLLAVYELVASRGVKELRGLSSQCTWIAFSNDGKRVAALSHNWEVAVWNLDSNRLERMFQAPRGISADNAALAFSPDDGQLAFSTSQWTVLWDLKGVKEPKLWPLPPGLVQRLCFDPAGRLLHFQRDTLRGADGTYYVRNLFGSDYQKPLSQIPQIQGDHQGAVLSRGGDWVVVVSETAKILRPKPYIPSYMVRFFDPLTGHELQGLPGRESWDPDSLRRNPEMAPLDQYLPPIKDRALITLLGKGPWRRHITVLSQDGSVLVARAPREKSMTLIWTNNPVARLPLGIDHDLANWPQFSPDGKMLAVGTTEGTLLVYDLEKTIQNLKALGLGWR